MDTGIFILRVCFGLAIASHGAQNYFVGSAVTESKGRAGFLKLSDFVLEPYLQLPRV